MTDNDGVPTTLFSTLPTSANFPFTNASNTTDLEPSVVGHLPSTVTGALILTLVFLLGVPGNGFVIWSILAHARKRSVTTLLILNLAVADGCQMALTVFFVVYLIKNSWVFGSAMCKVLFYMCNTNMYASIMLIMLMSLYRLVAVVRPQRLASVSHHTTLRHLLGVQWVLVFTMALPALIFRDEIEKVDDSGRTNLVCMPKHGSPKYIVFQYTFETVVGFLLPYAVIIFSYVCILRRLRKTKFRRMIRTENIILAIVVTFGLFWLPYHILNIVKVIVTYAPTNSTLQLRLHQMWKEGRAVTSSLAFISSCVNPILYTFAGRNYIREAGLSFMARLFEGIAQDGGPRKKQKGVMGLQANDSNTSNGPSSVAKNGLL